MTKKKWKPRIVLSDRQLANVRGGGIGTSPSVAEPPKPEEPKVTP